MDGGGRGYFLNLSRFVPSPLPEKLITIFRELAYINNPEGMERGGNWGNFYPLQAISLHSEFEPNLNVTFEFKKRRYN